MQLTTLAVVLSSLLAFTLAAPANHHALVRRQTTFYITCIGGHCNDGSTPAPTPPSKPSSSKKPDPPKTTSKDTPPAVTPTPSKPSSSKNPDPPKSTSVYTPPVVTPTPSKTVKSTPKSTIQSTKTSGGETGPSSTACPVPLYYQCGGYYGGKPWTGCTKCVKGAACVVQNEFYNQCVAEE